MVGVSLIFEMVWIWSLMSFLIRGLQRFHYGSVYTSRTVSGTYLYTELVKADLKDQMDNSNLTFRVRFGVLPNPSHCLFRHLLRDRDDILVYRGLFLLGYLIGMVMEQGESTEDGARLPCRA